MGNTGRGELNGEADPILKVLRDLGKMRELAYNDLLRLPAVSPFKHGLARVHKLLEILEDDIKSIHATLSYSPDGGG